MVESPCFFHGVRVMRGLLQEDLRLALGLGSVGDLDEALVAEKGSITVFLRLEARNRV